MSNEQYSEEEYAQRVEAFNELVLDYLLHWSNFERSATERPDKSISLAELWFKCPACDCQGGAEEMYLMQRVKQDGSVVIQSVSTFFDVTPDCNYSGVEAIFDLGATEVVMACRQCVIDDGHDPDSIEVIMPEYKESKLL